MTSNMQAPLPSFLMLSPRDGGVCLSHQAAGTRCQGEGRGESTTALPTSRYSNTRDLHDDDQPILSFLRPTDDNIKPKSGVVCQTIETPRVCTIATGSLLSRRSSLSQCMTIAPATEFAIHERDDTPAVTPYIHTASTSVELPFPITSPPGVANHWTHGFQSSFPCTAHSPAEKVIAMAQAVSPGAGQPPRPSVQRPILAKNAPRVFATEKMKLPGSIDKSTSNKSPKDSLMTELMGFLLADEAKADAATSSSQQPNATQPKANTGLDVANTSAKEGNTQSQQNPAAVSKWHKPIYRGPGNAKGNRNTQGATPNQNKRLNGKNQRNRGPRQSTWVKSRDIPKGDNDWGQNTWDNWGTNRRSDCWVGSDGVIGGKKTGIEIDPETGFQLADWTGTWAPAPVDWDSRPAFRPNQSEELIQKWVKKTHKALKHVFKNIQTNEMAAIGGDDLIADVVAGKPSGAMFKEVAPHYWVPDTIEKLSPSLFWNNFVVSNAPAPADEEDLDGVRPWWEKYDTTGDGSSDFIPVCAAPVIKGNDPSETEHERLARESDLGSSYHTDNRRRLERAKRQAEIDRNKKHQQKAKKLAELGVAISISQTRIRPRINKIFIRPAQMSDLGQIHRIYTYYIENTVSMPEHRRLTEEQVKQRIEYNLNAKLPFIVAVKPGERLRLKRYDGQIFFQPDTILGFAKVDDCHDATSMYRFTCKADIFVQSDHYMHRIGSCLLDKLLGIVDPHYLEKGGYRVEGDFGCDDAESSRKFRNIIVNFPYWQEARLTWVTRWFTEYGFQKVGEMTEIGTKLDRSVNMAMFQRKTGHAVAVASPANAT